MSRPWDDPRSTPVADISEMRRRVENPTPAEEVANHIRYKAWCRELPEETALKMLVALENGAEPDYRKLYIAAVRVPLALTAYHTSPVEFHAQIAAEGLRMALPSDGRWNINASGQPKGVYLGPQPDYNGQWAVTDHWDIWQVDTTGLPWQHDPMNETCWVVEQDIPPERLTFFGTYRW